MLQNLKVKNYALISDIEIQFSDGLNIITGETGAGKSILVGALGMVLGNRADTSALRIKDSKCIIEANFEIGRYDLKSFFEKNDLDYDSMTIVRREITSSGKSRAFINDTPTTLKVVASLGSKLIEIHSQRDNLQLFRADFQYDSLDMLAGCYTERLAYQKELKSYKELQAQLEKCKVEEAELAKETDYNKYLYNELQEAALEGTSEKDLFSEQEMLENAENLIATFNEANQLLEGSEYSVAPQLESLKQLLRKSGTTLTDDLTARIESVLIELKDISSEIDTSAQNIEVNPVRLEEVSERAALLHSLKSKHRVETIEELLNIEEQLSKKLHVTQHLGVKIKDLESRITKLESDLLRKAVEISKTRNSKSSEITNELNTMFTDLGMEHSRLRYKLDRVDTLNQFGINEISLELSSDKGNSYADVKKAASGGELARINLCLKNLLANHINMPSSIYDEIDTGVSGEVARKVGLMMKNMSNEQQVITITHLPQIASLGNHHLFVFKSENTESVETQVSTLKGEKRINEIAKMISGNNLTEHAIEQSKELLKH